jgi:hypothetical protein
MGVVEELATPYPYLAFDIPVACETCFVSHIKNAHVPPCMLPDKMHNMPSCMHPFDLALSSSLSQTTMLLP